MRRLILLLILSSLFLVALAQNNNPAINKTASKVSEFVTSGWKLIAEAKGDLNKDGLVDVALVIENTDTKNLIINKNRLGSDTLNTNPRHILVALRKANVYYELAVKNTSFIPSQNTEESPCLTDPFGENGSIEIENGLLKIHLQNFYSCGAWEIYNFDYIFRFQNQKFELIGYNKSSLHRSSGEETSMTMNFSTMKMNYTSGTNAFKDGGKPKTSWKNIKIKKRLELNTIKEEDIRQFDY